MGARVSWLSSSARCGRSRDRRSLVRRLCAESRLVKSWVINVSQTLLIYVQVLGWTCQRPPYREGFHSNSPCVHVQYVCNRSSLVLTPLVLPPPHCVCFSTHSGAS